MKWGRRERKGRFERRDRDCSHKSHRCERRDHCERRNRCDRDDWRRDDCAFSARYSFPARARTFDVPHGPRITCFGKIC